MENNGLILTISGTDAASTAEKVKTIFNNGLGANLKIKSSKTRRVFGKKTAEPAADKVFILAVPGSFLTCKDLLERLNKKRQLDEILHPIQKLVKSRVAKVKITYPDGTVKKINSVSSTSLIESMDMPEGE